MWRGEKTVNLGGLAQIMIGFFLYDVIYLSKFELPSQLFSRSDLLAWVLYVLTVIMALLMAVLFLHQAENFPRRYILGGKRTRRLHVMRLAVNYMIFLLIGASATGARSVLVMTVACNLYLVQTFAENEILELEETQRELDLRN